MKKIILALLLAGTLAGCGSESNIDERISARELPEYEGKAIDIEVTEGDKSDKEAIIIE